MKTKRQEIEEMLFEIYSHVGMDKPQNHDEILDFVYEDVDETADAVDWHSGDVSIAFRRWIEAQAKEQDNSYFKVVRQGFDRELMREEVQIHAGEFGNVFLIKNDLGFIVDVYGNGENVDTLTIWEEDLEGDFDDEDLEDELDEDEDLVEFSEDEINDFVAKFGECTDDLCDELGLDINSNDDIDALLSKDHFWFSDVEVWIPIEAPMYNEREQMIANVLRYVK